MNRYIHTRDVDEQRIREMQRRQAVIQSGHAFFVLELIDERKGRISGIDELIAVPTERPGKYLFKTEQRQLQFSIDPGTGVMSAHVLDTDWNRKFLASHLEENYWEITSVISGRKKPLDLDTVLEELAELRQKLIEETIEVVTEVPALLPNDSKHYDIANVDLDVLVKEIERRKKEIKSTTTSEAIKPRRGKKKTIVKSSKKEEVVKSSKKEEVIEDAKEDTVVTDNVPQSDFVGVLQP